MVKLQRRVTLAITFVGNSHVASNLRNANISSWNRFKQGILNYQFLLTFEIMFAQIVSLWTYKGGKM